MVADTLSYSGTSTGIPAAQISICLFYFLSFGRNVMTPSLRFSRAFHFRAHFKGILNCTCTGRLIWKLLFSIRAGANLGGYSSDFGKEKFLLPSNVCRYAYNHILNFLPFPELEKNLRRSNESFQNPVSQCSMSEVTRLILFPEVMGSPL